MADIDSSSSNPPDPQQPVNEKLQVENDSKCINQLTKDDLKAISMSTAMSMSGDHQGESTPPSIVIGPSGDATAKLMTSGLDSPRSGSLDSPRADCQSMDTRLSGVSGESGHGSLTDSQPTSARGRPSTSPLHKGRDPARISKDREREEKVRLARERMASERKRKFEELKEQQRIAQENRERQLELRRHKIEELRRRETERRIAVEDRRRQQEELERVRRESIVEKSQQRVARYEQWKNSGRSGGSGHYLGFGSRTPRDICQPLECPKRSSSHSALVRRSPNGSDWDYVRPQRRAQSACSTVRRHCCIDTNRSVGPSPWAANPPSKHMSMSMSVLYHKRNSEFASSGMLNHRPESVLALNTIPEGRRSFLASSYVAPQRPKSSVTNTSPVKLRETKSARKARPSSVATSMPTFVVIEHQSPRSKSTDRLSRVDKQDRNKHKTPRKSLPTPPTSAGSSKENKENSEGEEKENKSSSISAKVNRQTMERLSMPKHVRNKPDAVKEKPAKDKSETAGATATSKVESTKSTSRFARQHAPRKAYSTTNLTTIARKPVIKHTPDKPKPKESKPAPISKTPASAGTTPTVKPSATPVASSATPSAAASSTPSTATPATPLSVDTSETGSDSTLVGKTPDAMSKSMTDVSKSAQEISVLEYKAKLAEHRRQAREKAERAQELERQKQEQERLVEEERRREEEEEQRRLEEEGLRLAEEARKVEEERLEAAIAAEEQRKREEAERLEAEQIARQEAEQKAREEAEKLEKDREERKVKEEEERLERKKRLEMIMKRVKPDGAESPKTQSPAKSSNSSPSKSGDSSTDSGADEVPDETMTTMVTTTGATTTITTVITSDKKPVEEKPTSRGNSPQPDKMSESLSTPKFHSPLLQHLVESKSTENLSSERPKFKSPILQNLLGKNKIKKTNGKEELSSHPVIFSLEKDLSGNVEKDVSDSNEKDVSNIRKDVLFGIEQNMSDSVHVSDSVEKNESDSIDKDVSSTQHAFINDEDKDVDTSESWMAFTSPTHVKREVELVVENTDSKTSDQSVTVQNKPSDSPAKLGNGVDEFDPFSDLMMTSSNLTDEDKTMKSGADSGILVDLGTSGMSLTTMNGLTQNGVFQTSQELVDSSISMKSVDSTSVIDSVSHSNDFEEIIDLSVSNKAVQLKTQEHDSNGDKCEDLLNLNNIDESIPTPIIAFEETTTTRQDVTDLMS